MARLVVPVTTKGKNAMANQNHLTSLRADVDAWNHWRADHPHIIPDLSGAELTGTDLQRANLTAANLQGAHLDGANLRYANLAGANLQGASFEHASMDVCLGYP
jgi:uncharacterized protein YjbI with pentapeptide repeats